MSVDYDNDECYCYRKAYELSESIYDKVIEFTNNFFDSIHNHRPISFSMVEEIAIPYNQIHIIQIGVLDGTMTEPAIILLSIMAFFCRLPESSQRTKWIDAYKWTSLIDPNISYAKKWRDFIEDNFIYSLNEGVIKKICEKNS